MVVPAIATEHATCESFQSVRQARPLFCRTTIHALVEDIEAAPCAALKSLKGFRGKDGRVGVQARVLRVFHEESSTYRMNLLA
jgi:hypothetical protein